MLIFLLYQGSSKHQGPGHAATVPCGLYPAGTWGPVNGILGPGPGGLHQVLISSACSQALETREPMRKPVVELAKEGHLLEELLTPCDLFPSTNFSHCDQDHNPRDLKVYPMV